MVRHPFHVRAERRRGIFWFQSEVWSRRKVASEKRLVKSRMNCAREKCAHACVQWRVLCTPPRRVPGICYCLDVKLPEKMRSAVSRTSVKKQQNARLQMESELRSTWTTVKLLAHANTFLRLFGAWICRCRSYLLSHHSLSCHPCECHSCQFWSQDDELHHVGLGDPDWRWWWLLAFKTLRFAKFSAKWKLNHSKNCWSSGSSLLFCRVLDFNGILGTPCPSAWKRTGKRRRETGDDPTHIMDGIKIEWVRATQTHWVARLVCWRRTRQLTPSPWRSSTGDLTT